MTAADFRAALKALGWSQAETARRLAVANQQRVSEWHRGSRAVPPYIAAHVRTWLELESLRQELNLENREPAAED